MGLSTTLFGTANNIVFFDAQRSLDYNFISMCSLQLLKKRSQATLDLIEFLKSIELNVEKLKADDVLEQRKLEQHQRLHNIIQLEMVKLAIDNWYSKRWLDSTRIESVLRFRQEVSDFQVGLIEAYNINLYKETLYPAFGFQQPRAMPAESSLKHKRSDVRRMLGQIVNERETLRLEEHNLHTMIDTLEELHYLYYFLTPKQKQQYDRFKLPSAFNRDHTLYANFVATCSLPFYKRRSKDTQILANTLKVCVLHSAPTGEALDTTKLLANIMVLELARAAISKWLLVREHESERKGMVKQYDNALLHIQTEYVEQYNAQVSERQALVSSDLRNTLAEQAELTTSDLLTHAQVAEYQKLQGLAQTPTVSVLLQHEVFELPLQYNPKKSLKDNFLALCPFFESFSAETKALVKLLTVCHLSATVGTATLSQTDKLKNIMVLQLAMNAFESWRAIKQSNSRINEHKMHDYKAALLCMQSKLMLEHDNVISFNPRHRDEQPIMGMDVKAVLGQYLESEDVLSSDAVAAYKECMEVCEDKLTTLADIKESAAPRSMSWFNQILMIPFVPGVNPLFDLDCLNLGFDTFNSLLDLIRVF